MASLPVLQAIEARASGRFAIVLLGLLLPQLWLHGSSLIGWTVPYPCDLLAQANHYLPNDEAAGVVPKDRILGDLVTQMAPERMFCAAEFRAGRLPLWNPYLFFGVPSVNHAKYSPYELLYVLCPTTQMVAALLVLQAVVAGGGAYRAFRELCGSSFWSAAVCGWAYPLTGYFVMWQGFTMPQAVTWLPWVLLAVKACLDRPWGWGGPGLVAATCACVMSRFDAGGQVLLVSGLFALFSWNSTLRSPFWTWTAVSRLIAPALAWTLGLVLCLPYLLPFIEFAKTGVRMQDRLSGKEERPPRGIAALPQAFVPHIQGTTRYGGWTWSGKGNLPESAAQAHCGLVAMLFVMPLAWGDPKRRRMTVFWSAIFVLGLAWQLNIPILVQLLRCRGINMLQHNRFPFASCFATLALSSIGWDVLREGPSLAGRRWLALPLAFAAGFGVWCLVQTNSSAEQLARTLPRHGLSRDEIAAFQSELTLCGLWAAARCAAIAAAVIFVLAGRQRDRWIRTGAAGLMLLELLLVARFEDRSAEARLYYPPIPALTAIRGRTPGRIFGEYCFPPNYAITHGLRDIRGYDAIDTEPVIELLELFRVQGIAPPAYARTQWMRAMIGLRSNGDAVFPPVMSMLNVRYVILRVPPLSRRQLVAESPDYWVLENPGALPRAWVPKRVEVLEKPIDVFRELLRKDFQPRDTAYVQEPVEVGANVQGTARITLDEPQHIRIEVQADSPALVVLADLFDAGWTATVDGRAARILRTNTALRGVPVPAGPHVVEFRYQPASFTLGLRLAAVALGCLAIWSGVVAFLRRRSR